MAKTDLLCRDRIMNQPNSSLEGLRIHRKPEPEAKSMLWRLVALAVILLLLVAVVWWYFLPQAIEVQTA